MGGLNLHKGSLELRLAAHGAAFSPLVDSLNHWPRSPSACVGGDRVPEGSQAGRPHSLFGTERVSR